MRNGRFPGISAADLRFNVLLSSHVGDQCLRNPDLAGRCLVHLEDRHDYPRQGESGTVQRVDELRLCALLSFKPYPCPSRLKILEIAARRDLEPPVGSGRPGLDVVAFRRGEAQIAAAQFYHPVRQLQGLEDRAGIVEQDLEFIVRVLRQGPS